AIALEAELLKKFIGALSAEAHAGVCQIRMLEQAGHQPCSMSIALMLLIDDNIHDHAHCRFVGDDPSKADQPIFEIDAEPERGLAQPRDLIARIMGSPEPLFHY